MIGVADAPRIALLLLLLPPAMFAGCAVYDVGSDGIVNSGGARPNLVLFVVDDLGWQDCSLALHDERTPFNDRYRTPALETLASRGIRFTSAYAASPVCTPTRTSIMTGLHPARTRITNWTLRNDLDQQETGPKDYPLQSPRWNFSGLDRADSTLPSYLGDAGYRTIHIGKAHFGAVGTDGADPTRLGFDVNIAGHAAGAPASYLAADGFSKKTPSVWDVPGLEAYHGEDLFLTDVLTREALREVEAAVAADEPFFLHLSHYAVHTPLAPDASHIDAYLDAGLDRREAMYAAMIEGVDASLAALLAKLSDLGVADDTFLVFVSDNGGLTYAARGRTPTGTGANTHNAPLRSGKGSAYEGGTRVPMVMAWCGDAKPAAAAAAAPIAADAVCAVPVTTADLLPTLLAVAGLEPPAVPLDGASLVGLFDGVPDGSSPLPSRPLYWHYPHKWGPDGPGYDPFTSIRIDEWKLIHFYRDATWELYNLRDDLSESSDRIADEPEIASRLATQLHAWMQAVAAQTPRRRATGEPLALPRFRPAADG